MEFVKWLCIVLGIIMFLVINFPVLFWFVIVPVVVIGFLKLVGWLKK